MPTAGSLTDQVAHWSLLLCAAALGIILGETYQKPQAASAKLQATSGKQQALDIARIKDYIGYMLKKDLEKIVGGLSKPSKMPGPAYNLPAYKCITGQKLAKVPGSVCFGCYALKGRYRFRPVKSAMERRLEALKDPGWVDAMIQLIKPHKEFRWHDSGDIQSLEHLQNIFRVCRSTPGTKHWLPTREAQILKRVKVNEVPRNLVIRFSSHMVDQGPVSFWPWTSTVTTDGQHSCPSSKQGNKCLDCRACWDRDIRNISYGKH